MRAINSSAQKAPVNTFAPITHWCRQCDSHYPTHRVCRIVPAPVSPDSEVGVLICPKCSSYDIEELQEVSDAQ